MPEVRRVTTATGRPHVPPKKPVQKRKVPAVVGRISEMRFEEGDGIKVNIFGASGTGKSTFAATFPGPILWVLCSGTKRPGELRSVNTKENREKVRQVVLTDTMELRDLADWLDDYGEEGGGDYRTVVLDHVTGYQDLMLMEVLGVTSLPAQKSFGIASWEQWGQIKQQCSMGLKDLLSLRQNVVVIGQERMTNPKEETGQNSELLGPTLGVDLIPSLARWLFSTVDYIGQTFIRQKTVVKWITTGKGQKRTTKRKEIRVKDKFDYCLRCGSTDVIRTKFRVPKFSLPPFIPDPSYDKMMEVIRGEWVPDAPPEGYVEEDVLEDDGEEEGAEGDDK